MVLQREMGRFTDAVLSVQFVKDSGSNAANGVERILSKS